MSRGAACAYCAHLTAAHYENFSVVTWLTPREHRPAFQSIYAFCRWSDDLGDEIGDPARSVELLKWWRGELRAMFQGQARHPVMVALAETVSSYKIPIDPFEALIDAFVQDQTVTEYQTLAQLVDYCTRSFVTEDVFHGFIALAPSTIHSGPLQPRPEWGGHVEAWRRSRPQARNERSSQALPSPGGSTPNL